ncbi:8748_t:CDS:10 [Ambispora leptoticha]|uniref:Mechanosensitive ion channel protein n=1 Tax=Ambispora leptoticha TaxID=144679 RepID=A0A9N9FVC7_9GLOM|nr:8748_t:CDS:10 [Ambispora leptoticha]
MSKTNNNLKVGGYNLDDAVSLNSEYDEDGDLNSVSRKEGHFKRFRRWFHTFSVGTRSLLYIFPGLAVFAVFAVLGYLVWNKTNIADVPLHIWAIWLGVCWFALFASRFVVFLVPYFLEWILGHITSRVKRYMEFIRHLHYYISLCAFLCVAFLSFVPIMVGYNAKGGVMTDWQYTTNRILAVCFIASGIISFEKLLLQVVAVKFHETTYQERIANNKYQVSVLTSLYAASKKKLQQSTNEMILPRSDSHGAQNINFTKIISQTKNALEKTTSALGQIASEITGHQFDSTLNSSEVSVLNYLQTGHDARVLGRRLFRSFCNPKRNHLVFEDICDCFPNQEAAENAFFVFDKDGNGDVSKEEILIVCVETYKERKAIAASMRDLDNAVGKLDSILMVVIYFVIILLFVAFLDVSFQTYIATAGSILLALSFMVGSSAQALFECIIFLFVKHPFDVGDRIEIEEQGYIVKEMSLLSTVLTQDDGKIVQAANNLLAQKLIQNIRRSGHMRDEVLIEVDFYTSLEQIEALRERMVTYLEGEDRDFYPTLELTVEKMPKCRQLVIKISVEHKSNWQDEGVTCRRKNKFMCQLKNLIIDLDIQGPFAGPKLPIEKMVLPARPLRIHPIKHDAMSPKTDFTLGAKSDVFDVEDKETMMRKTSVRRRRTKKNVFGSDEEDEHLSVNNNMRQSQQSLHHHTKVDIVVTDEQGLREKQDD